MEFGGLRAERKLLENFSQYTTLKIYGDRAMQICDEYKATRSPHGLSRIGKWPQNFARTIKNAPMTPVSAGD